jgi:radical SAM superfamily enzyme YgiQ (UPF0313 family)
MRILLIQPGDGEELGFRQTALVEPLGLETVGGALAGHQLRLLDLRVGGDLEKELARFGPELVGINCSFTLDRNKAIAVAEAAKAGGDRGVPYVVVGGHYASVSPGDFAHPAVDAVVVGEGETTMAELVGCLEREEDPSRVSGLVLNGRSGQTRTGVRRLATRLDDLPMPARGLTRGHRKSYYLFTERPMATVETARGCPYHCSFCSVWQFYRGRYRAKGPKRVVREIAAVEEPYILFTDDNFLADVDRAMQIAMLVLEEGLQHRYAFQARSDSIVANPDVVRLWRKAGLEGVFIGMEKINDSGLQGIRKENSAENNERALEILRKEGVGVTASFIVDPEWELEDFQALRQYVVSHDLEVPSFSVLTPLPGTMLHRQMRDKIRVRAPELYDLLHAVVPTRLPLEQFYQQFSALYRESYTAQRLWSSGPRLLWQALSKGNLAHLQRLAQAARGMGEAETYLAGHRRWAEPSPSPEVGAVALQGVGGA